MPLTSSQATPSNIINSLKDFLSTNVVTPYNNAVLTTSYPNPLRIVLGIPDDPDVYLQVPLIAIELPLRDFGSETIHAVGMGDGIVWRYKQVIMCCYPAVTQDGKPSVQAANTLMGLMDYIGTALYIPIKDFSTTPATQAEAAQVMGFRLFEPRGRSENILAIEKNRFDVRIDLRYPQLTING